MIEITSVCSRKVGGVIDQRIQSFEELTHFQSGWQFPGRLFCFDAGRRPIHLHVMVSEDELALIQEHMAEADIRNIGAYMWKMALNGYVLQADLSPVQKLVSLQRRRSNNLNQVAIQANTYGGIYPEEIKALQRDYEML